MNESDERVFLERKDVYVSDRRVIVEGTTYSLANITSVSKTKTPPRRGCASIILIFGLLAAMGFLGELFSKNPMSENSYGSLILIVPCLIFPFYIFKSKPKFNVILMTSAREQNVLSSTDEKAIDEVVSAISNAIVSANK